MNYLKINLAALKKKQPELARRLQSVTACGRYAVEGSRAGPPALFILHANGVRKTLHSSYDPVREASRFIESLDVKKHLHFLVMGLGLGYHLLEIVKRVSPAARILIIEKKLELAQLALANNDLTPVFERAGVCLQVGMQPEEWDAVLGDDKTAYGLNGFVAVDFKPLLDAEAEYYVVLKRSLDKVLQESRIDIRTKAARSKIFYRNIIKNWDALLSSPGIAELKDILAGVPCVMVSAGPSLDKNVALLKPAAEKVLIVTVATALNALKIAGIRPDFVMANDPDDSTLRAFGIEPTDKDLWLVYDPCVPQEIVASFPGRRLAAESGVALSQWLSKNHMARGSLGKVFSVAHSAFQFARHLGCTPIILTGQDLAFDRTRLHCSGSFYDQGHRDLINEKQQTQTLDRNKFLGFSDSLGTLSDLFGRHAATTRALDTYRNRFAEAIDKADDVINATEGGIPIPGVINITLQEALYRYCREPIGENMKSFLEHIDSPACPEALITSLDEQIVWFKKVHARVVALKKKYAHLYNGAAGEKQEFVRETEALYQFLLEEPESLRLMQGYLYGEFAQWSLENSRLMQQEGSVPENEILKGKAERDEKFLPVLEEASGYLATEFEAMAARVKRKIQDRIKG